MFKLLKRPSHPPCRPRIHTRFNSRSRIIHQIQNNPELVSGSNGRWGRFLVTALISTTSAMSLFLAIEVVKVWNSENETRKNVYLPLWLGVNWPSQRKWAWSAYTPYLSSAALPDLDLAAVQDEIPGSVLDCLFRSPMVRETYGLPLKVAESGDFEVWLEPHYPTVHGPRIAIKKSCGSINFSLAWTIKSLTWNAAECIQATLWRFGSAVSPAAETHAYGSGRVHEIHADAAPHLEKAPEFKVVFRGNLTISSRQHSGVVSYTGTLDEAHGGLHHGVRLNTVDLRMSEGGVLIHYKVFDDTH